MNGGEQVLRPLLRLLQPSDPLVIPSFDDIEADRSISSTDVFPAEGRNGIVGWERASTSAANTSICNNSNKFRRNF